MKKHSLLLTLFTCLFLSVQAQDFTVNVNELINETQIMSDEADRMRLVWWIPTEYWEHSLANDPSGAAQIESIVVLLDQYTVFAIADGEMSDFGGIEYVALELLTKNLELVDHHGDKFKPIPEKKINQDTKLFLAMMKPVFANMLGSMGENLHFVLFPKENLEGQRLLDPMKEGEFTVKIFDETLSWELPLGSLFKPKKCPIDQREWNGTWKFCPKHGDKLQ
jgi:hypothetical protein